MHLLPTTTITTYCLADQLDGYFNYIYNDIIGSDELAFSQYEIDVVVSLWEGYVFTIVVM